MPQTEPTYDYKYLKKPLTAGVIGCPFSCRRKSLKAEGTGREAATHALNAEQTGPLELIEAGLLGDIEALGWKVDFAGADNLSKSITAEHANGSDPDIGKLKQPRLVSQVNKEVAERVYAHSSKGELTVTLGGDHSLAMATVSGTFKAHPDAALIWVDAHACLTTTLPEQDINTPLTTPSGNLHGCPVSFLMGLPGTSKEEIPEFGWIEPVLKAERLVYIGLRDIDEGERKILKDNKIKCFTMHHVDKYGIGKVVEMALEHVGQDRPIHLSFDVDALDPTVAPSTGTAVRGGLSFREGHYICEGTIRRFEGQVAVAETGRLVSLDIMEINPSIAAMEGDVQQTVDVGRSLVRCALGETLL
ncbi:putative Arginase [Rhodotorula taiwanensis]|uniref:Arginase n=1 Tax=Rhodotorula taiwanensis TaxID=741276 RepID=A0A2S5BER0_9BASI|nr:putative Arginase [Rhodotorula taiwanensis]